MRFTGSFSVEVFTDDDEELLSQAVRDNDAAEVLQTILETGEPVTMFDVEVVE